MRREELEVQFPNGINEARRGMLGRTTQRWMRLVLASIVFVAACRSAEKSKYQDVASVANAQIEQAAQHRCACARSRRK